MNKIKPYNDRKMKFDDDKYTLTLEIVREKFGNPFADDNVLKTRIYMNTNKVYNRLFDKCNSRNIKVVKNIIASTEEYRKFIYDCLMSQMASDMASGYNDNDKYIPESYDQRELQRSNQISVETEMIMDNSISYGGLNLCYSGIFPPLLQMKFREY